MCDLHLSGNSASCLAKELIRGLISHPRAIPQSFHLFTHLFLHPSVQQTHLPPSTRFVVLISCFCFCLLSFSSCFMGRCVAGALQLSYSPLKYTFIVIMCQFLSPSSFHSACIMTLIFVNSSLKRLF